MKIGWLGICAVVACGTPPDFRPTTSEVSPAWAQWKRPSTPAVIAHRGGRVEAPEETLETLAVSVEAGADVLELDLHLTRDGVVVCLHDGSVDRTTDGAGPVADLTWAELQSFDAGARFCDAGGVCSYAGRGVKVPSLDAVLSAFPSTLFILEQKDPSPAAVAATLRVLRKHNAMDRVVMASFQSSALDAFRAAEDGPATSFSPQEVVAYLWSGERPPAAFLQVPPGIGPWDLVTAEFVDQAHADGIVVQVWTISDPSEMARLRDLGVDGILTPDPRLLRQVVDARATTP